MNNKIFWTTASAGAALLLTTAVWSAAARQPQSWVICGIVLGVAAAQMTLWSAGIIFSSTRRQPPMFAGAALGAVIWALAGANATGHPPLLWLAWWVLYASMSTLMLALFARWKVWRGRIQFSLGDLLLLTTLTAAVMAASRWLMMAGGAGRLDLSALGALALCGASQAIIARADIETKSKTLRQASIGVAAIVMLWWLTAVPLSALLTMVAAQSGAIVLAWAVWRQMQAGDNEPIVPTPSLQVFSPDEIGLG